MITLFKMNSLDALTCVFALALEARSKNNPHEQKNFEMGFLKIFLRLSALTELRVIYKPLYKRISEIFNQSLADDDRLTLVVDEHNLPLQIVPNDWVDIDSMVDSYLDVLASAKKLGLVSGCQKEKRLFLYTINHTNFRDVQHDLAALANMGLDDSHLVGHTRKTIERFNRYLKKS